MDHCGVHRFTHLARLFEHRVLHRWLKVVFASIDGTQTHSPVTGTSDFFSYYYFKAMLDYESTLDSEIIICALNCFDVAVSSRFKHFQPCDLMLQGCFDVIPKETTNPRQRSFAFVLSLSIFVYCAVITDIYPKKKSNLFVFILLLTACFETVLECAHCCVFLGHD